MAKTFTRNPLCINEKRHAGEAMKAKNENLLTRAHARAFIFLHADATFLIAIRKRILYHTFKVKEFDRCFR
ncbi:MAG: hypothetical protein HXL30_05965 [Prevotellaceae bacterium]|nr:hypothetical protein [Prevotellaceae bacterium]